MEERHEPSGRAWQDHETKFWWNGKKVVGERKIITGQGEGIRIEDYSSCIWIQ